MYPLVVIFMVALWSDDSRFLKYSWPFSTIGFAIASYHILLYYGILAESIVPCSKGVSCTTKQVEIFGFLTIPLMSWMSFLAINILALAGVFLKEEK